MYILGIETSCDETAAAVLKVQNGRLTVLSNVVSSQVELHAQYGGVVPQLAAREHEKNIRPVFEEAMKKAKIKEKDIDLIAVTAGPGLIMALLVGVRFANELAEKFDKPIVGVNHLEGHIYSNWLSPVRKKTKLQTPKFPLLNLIVSGGHTMLVLMNGHGDYELLGETVDDAAGEAFDKVARMLELGYPGGPAIARLAEQWKSQITNPKLQTKSKTQIPNIGLPRPMMKQKNYDFSFSGLKTAVLYTLRGLKEKHSLKEIRPAMAHEFQQSVVDVLVTKTMRAAEEYAVSSVALSGGVAANALLRKALQEECSERQLPCFVPDMSYTGDNAAMIAFAGYYRMKDKIEDYKWKKVEPDANLRLT